MRGPQSRPATRRRTTPKLLVAVPVALIGGFAGSFGWPWYQWATAGESPYDEVGIDVNNMMPAPMHNWACARIAQRFPGTLPPSGC